MHKITLICVLLGILDVIKCDWWENAVIYEIYTKSFKDSDGDGIGDVNGITSKLDYIAELGADAIWLPGIFSTSGTFYDQQYGITNHRELNRIFGKMEDFQRLVTKAKEKGLKILLDFYPAFTSYDHIWFLKSVQNETKYIDYYIWENPKGFDKKNRPISPDYQRSEVHDSYWIYNEIRKQFYFGKFTSNFPKLNLKNPVVVEEMKEIWRFWLEIGVDGFYVKNALGVIDELWNVNKTLKESHKLLHEFREILDEYKKTDGFTRLLIADQRYYINELSSCYDRSDYTIAHFPFDKQQLMSFYNGFHLTAIRIKSSIDNVMDTVPDGKVAAWASESEEKSRIASDWGFEYISIAAVQTLLLPGVGNIFYGQEIGLRCVDDYTDFTGYFKENFIIFANRMGEICPMQWDSTLFAGFTNSVQGPWKTISADYWKLNVEEQKRSKDSYYNFFKELIKLKKTDTCKYGDVKTYVLSNFGFAFTRSYQGKEIYSIVMNLNFKLEFIELNDLFPKSTRTLKVLIGSPNSLQKTGEIVEVNKNGKLVIEMRPLSVTVLSAINLNKQ